MKNVFDAREACVKKKRLGTERCFKMLTTCRLSQTVRLDIPLRSMVFLMIAGSLRVNLKMSIHFSEQFKLFENRLWRC